MFTSSDDQHEKGGLVRIVGAGGNRYTLDSFFFQ